MKEIIVMSIYFFSCLVMAIWVTYRKYCIYTFEKECMKRIKDIPFNPIFNTLDISRDEFVARELKTYLEMKPGHHEMLWSIKKLNIENWFDRKTQFELFGILPKPKVFNGVKKNGLIRRIHHRQ